MHHYKWGYLCFCSLFGTSCPCLHENYSCWLKCLENLPSVFDAHPWNKSCFYRVTGQRLEIKGGSKDRICFLESFLGVQSSSWMAKYSPLLFCGQVHEPDPHGSLLYTSREYSGKKREQCLPWMRYSSLWGSVTSWGHSCTSACAGGFPQPFILAWSLSLPSKETWDKF